MNNSKEFTFLRQALILGQLFLIIFVHHILKDLKDSLVITASDAGAEVIPFIKIWGVLPISVLASYLFSKFYQKFGRDKTLYFFITTLLTFYAIFAFWLYPQREMVCLDSLGEHLKRILPAGCRGMIAMVRFWSYTVFYLDPDCYQNLPHKSLNLNSDA